MDRTVSKVTNKSIVVRKECPGNTKHTDTDPVSVWCLPFPWPPRFGLAATSRRRSNWETFRGEKEWNWWSRMRFEEREGTGEDVSWHSWHAPRCQTANGFGHQQKAATWRRNHLNDLSYSAEQTHLYVNHTHTGLVWVQQLTPVWTVADKAGVLALVQQRSTSRFLDNCCIYQFSPKMSS